MGKQFVILLTALLGAGTIAGATLEEPASSVAAIDTSGRLTILAVMQKSMTVGPAVEGEINACF